MLTVDPELRPTARATLDAAWLTPGAPPRAPPGAPPGAPPHGLVRSERGAQPPDEPQSWGTAAGKATATVRSRGREAPSSAEIHPGVVPRSISEMCEVPGASLRRSEIGRDRDCSELEPSLSQRSSLFAAALSDHGLSTTLGGLPMVYSDEAHTQTSDRAPPGGLQLAEAEHQLRCGLGPSDASCLPPCHSEALRRYTTKRARARGDSTASAHQAASRIRARGVSAVDSGRASLSLPPPPPPPAAFSAGAGAGGLGKVFNGLEAGERLSRFEVSLLTGARHSSSRDILARHSHRRYSGMHLEGSSHLERVSQLDRSSQVSISLPEIGECVEAPPCMARRSAVAEIAEIDLEDEAEAELW